MILGGGLAATAMIGWLYVSGHLGSSLPLVLALIGLGAIAVGYFLARAHFKANTVDRGDKS